MTKAEGEWGFGCGCGGKTTSNELFAAKFFILHNNCWNKFLFFFFCFILFSAVFFLGKERKKKRNNNNNKNRWREKKKWQFFAHIPTNFKLFKEIIGVAKDGKERRQSLLPNSTTSLYLFLFFFSRLLFCFFFPSLYCFFIL